MFVFVTTKIDIEYLHPRVYALVIKIVWVENHVKSSHLLVLVDRVTPAELVELCAICLGYHGYRKREIDIEWSTL